MWSFENTMNHGMRKAMPGAIRAASMATPSRVWW